MKERSGRKEEKERERETFRETDREFRGQIYLAYEFQKDRTEIRI